MKLPQNILLIIDTLKADQTVSEIWLIGSRASKQATPKSDWDLLVFSSAEPCVSTQRAHGVDVLWKGPSGAVLLEGQSDDCTLQFSDFLWTATSPDKATYRGRKFNDVPDGVTDVGVPLQTFVEGKALCLWSRNI